MRGKQMLRVILSLRQRAGNQRGSDSDLFLAHFLVLLLERGFQLQLGWRFGHHRALLMDAHLGNKVALTRRQINK